MSATSIPQDHQQIRETFGRLVAAKMAASRCSRQQAIAVLAKREPGLFEMYQETFTRPQRLPRR